MSEENTTYSSKFVSVIKEGVTRNRIDYTSDIIADSFWDDGGAYYNDFPQFFAEVLSSSPTASACLSVLKDFIEGEGLTDNSENILVNNETTLGELNTMISNDLAYLGRFAVLVKYKFETNREFLTVVDKAQKAKSIQSKKKLLAKLDSFQSALTVTGATLHYLPAEYVRWGKPDFNGEVSHVVYNPYFDTSEETLKFQERKYPLFDTAKVQDDFLSWASLNPEASEAYQFGQVLFYNKTDETDRVYSKPEFVCAKDAMLAEKEILLFHLRNAQNNFLLGGLINAYGNPNQPVVDKNGNDTYETVGEQFNKQMQDLFAGAKNAGSFMVVWNRLADQEFKLEPFSSNSNDQKFLTTAEMLRDAIITAMQVPPVLAGVQIAGKLGDAKEKTGAILFMNNRVRSFIRTKDAILSKLMSVVRNTPTQIETIRMKKYEILPDYVYNSLPESAKIEVLREEFGIETTQTETTTE